MYAPEATRNLARRLRKTMTPPELRLWKSLRRSAQGLRFRKQHAVGPYVLDFYCDSARLCVEVDGAWHSHTLRQMRDRERDIWLERGGVLTLRVSAKAVLHDPTGVIDGIIGFAIQHNRMKPPQRTF